MFDFASFSKITFNLLNENGYFLRPDILDISEKCVVLQWKCFRFQCTYKSRFIFPNSEFWIQFKIGVERYWKKESSFLFLIKHYTSFCFIVKMLFIFAHIREMHQTDIQHWSYSHIPFLGMSNTIYYVKLIRTIMEWISNFVYSIG